MRQSHGGKNDLWNLLFGQNKGDVVSDNGLHLLYYGYKWKWSISNSLTLYEQVFTPTGNGTKSNMHNRQKRTISHDVIFKNHSERDIYVNVTSQCTEAHPYLNNNVLRSSDGSQKFFGDNDNVHHYIFRFAEGEELAKQSGAAYDKKTKMSGFDDVYVYNLKYGLDVNAKCEKREDIQNAANAGSLAAPEVGCIIGADGKFYEKKSQAVAQSGKAVAIVMALSDKAHPLENGTEYNGMAMFLPEKGNYISSTISADYGYDCGLQKHNVYAEYMAELNGLAVTNQMVNGCSKEHEHPAAVQVRNYQNTLTAEGRQRHNFSPWFIPSFGQFLRALEAYGFVIPTSEKKGEYEDGQKNVDEIFKAAELSWGGSSTGGLRTLTCSLAPTSEHNYEKYVQASWDSFYFSDIDKFIESNPQSSGVVYPFILFQY